MKTFTHSQREIARILSTSTSPLMIAVGKDSGESLSVFNDTSGATLVTNVENPRSPVNGELLARAVTEGNNDVSFDSADVTYYPHIADCTKCESQLHSSESMAADLDGLDISCVNCGNTVEVSYYGEILDELAMDDLSMDDDMDDDDGDDDTIDDDDDDDDDDMNDDPEDGDDDMDDESGDDKTKIGGPSDDDDDDDGDKDGKPLVDEEDDKKSKEDKPEAKNKEDKDGKDDMSDTTTLEGDVEVLRTATIEDNAGLSMLSIDESLSRVHVFLGDTHVGTLNRELASADAASAYDKPTVLRSTMSVELFRHLGAIRDNSKVDMSEGLTALGFVPAKLSVSAEVLASEVGDEIKKTVEEQVEEQVEQRVDESIQQFRSTLELAMAGVNKGLLEGSSFHGGLAKLLAEHGVLNPAATATRFVEQASADFLSSSIEHAKIIASRPADYAQGIAHTVSTSGYRSPDVSGLVHTANSTLIAPSMQTTKEPVVTPKTASPQADVSSTQQKGNPYRKFFQRMR